jgi:hypothetical protein
LLIIQAANRLLPIVEHHEEAHNPEVKHVTAPTTAVKQPQVGA